MNEANPVVDATAPSFSAVLLAGGQSTRMGFDKATLEIGGEPLWLRQIGVLQELGVADIFISGPASGPWQGRGFRVIEDTISGRGPMGAIAEILETISTSQMVVLAVDMPAMISGFLKKLMSVDHAIVPKKGEFFEPLAAVYSKSNVELLNEYLSNGERSLQAYLREAVRCGDMAVYNVTNEEKPLFTNLNEWTTLTPAQRRNVCRTTGTTKDEKS